MKDLFNTVDIQELKLIYGVLHKNLLMEPALMDSLFLEELQAHLQKRAQEEGVDTSNHGEWDRWLKS